MEQKHKYSSHKSRILLTDKAKEDRGFPIYHYYHQLNVVAVIYFVYEVVVIVVNKAVRQLVTATKVYEFCFFFLKCTNIGASRDVPDVPRCTSVVVNVVVVVVVVVYIMLFTVA